MIEQIPLINIHDYRSLLCLNGDLPKSDFFKYKLPIVAADGGANKLMAMGIKPDYVIGDLDSIDSLYLNELKLLYRPDQNFCDFQKSLHFMEENNLLPSIVLGVNGDALDHVLKNINLICGSKNVLYAPPITGFSMLASEEIKLTLPIETKLSLIGTPSAIVTTTGLKWELTRYQMNFPGKNSFYNRTISKEIKITVCEGAILALIYGN